MLISTRSRLIVAGGENDGLVFTRVTWLGQHRATARANSAIRALQQSGQPTCRRTTPAGALQLSANWTTMQAVLCDGRLPMGPPCRSAPPNP